MIPLILTGIRLEYDNVRGMKTRVFLEEKTIFLHANPAQTEQVLYLDTL